MSSVLYLLDLIGEYDWVNNIFKKAPSAKVKM